jgi:hypothetical protein
LLAFFVSAHAAAQARSSGDDSASANAASPAATPATTLVDRESVAPVANRLEYGGAGTAPFALFTPATALPRWASRVVLGTEAQTAMAQSVPLVPFISAALGFGYGVVAELGAQWTSENSSVANGFEPYVGARVQIVGRRDGIGPTFALGARFRWGGGFDMGHPEIEGHATFQYRAAKFETGADLVFGQAIGAPDRDVEFRPFVVYRVIPIFAVGIGGQARLDLAADTLPSMGVLSDFRGGAIASVNIERFQAGLLAGASNYNLPTGVAVSPYGQVMVGYRFN